METVQPCPGKPVTTVFSFDIGKVNFACCQIDIATEKPIFWRILDLSQGHSAHLIQDLSDNMIQLLDELTELNSQNW